jgi:hypothetical protein
MAAKTEVRSACDDLPLLLAAAVHHPRREVRHELRRALAEWVNAARPRFTTRQIDITLRNEQGTAIEPFALNRLDRALAAIMARSAFSEQHDQTRFRIVSRETIGSDGGLMITNNLRSYYVERYAYGFRRRSSERFGFIAPAAMPTPEWIADRRRCSALAIVDDQGIRIRVVGFDAATEMGVQPHEITGAITRHGTIQGLTSLPLSRGFRVEIGKTDLSIRTLGSEAMLQLAAHMAQGSTLVLAAAPSLHRARLFVRLEPLDGERMPLRCIATATSGSLPRWVEAEAPQGPEIRRQTRVALAQWFRPHENWMDDEMLEALL